MSWAGPDVVVVAGGARNGFWPRLRLPVNVFVAVGVSRGMQGVVSTSQPHVGGDVEARVEHDAYAIYERHYREMVGLARLLVGDVATAEDIVHDATIRLHASLQRVRDPDRVVAYYRSIVLNLATMCGDPSALRYSAPSSRCLADSGSACCCATTPTSTNARSPTRSASRSVPSRRTSTARRCVSQRL